MASIGRSEGGRERREGGRERREMGESRRAEDGEGRRRAAGRAESAPQEVAARAGGADRLGPGGLAGDDGEAAVRAAQPAARPENPLAHVGLRLQPLLDGRVLCRRALCEADGPGCVGGEAEPGGEQLDRSGRGVDARDAPLLPARRVGQGCNDTQSEVILAIVV